MFYMKGIKVRKIPFEMTTKFVCVRNKNMKNTEKHTWNTIKCNAVTLLCIKSTFNRENNTTENIEREREGGKWRESKKCDKQFDKQEVKITIEAMPKRCVKSHKREGKNAFWKWEKGMYIINNICF